VAAILAQGEVETRERAVCNQLGVNSMDEVTRIPEKTLQAQVERATPDDLETRNLQMEEYYRSTRGIWFLYAAAGLGLLGTFLILFEQGLSAAILLLVAILGPALVLPQGLILYLLMYTGALPLAGLLAFFVRPKPRLSRATAEA
jgi:hypothetical protein